MLSWQELRPLPWKKLSAAMRTLRLVAMTAWLFGVATFGLAHSVMDPARYQPTIADSVYRHPFAVGDTIHFITDEQDRVNSVARPLALVSWLFAAVGIGASAVLETRRKRKLEKETMDRVLI